MSDRVCGVHATDGVRHHDCPYCNQIALDEKDAEIQRLQDECNLYSGIADERCEALHAADTEIERLHAYANKLAAGLPEGMLPADIENLRESNAKMALEIERLKRELEDARLDLWIEQAYHANTANYYSLCRERQMRKAARKAAGGE